MVVVFGFQARKKCIGFFSLLFWSRLTMSTSGVFALLGIIDAWLHRQLECTKWLIFCSQIVHVIWWNVFFYSSNKWLHNFFRLFKIMHRNAIHVSVYKIVCITNIWHHKKTISHGLFAVALGTSILAFYEFQILN